MKAVKLLNSYNMSKVGIRFTITKETLPDLEFIFDLAEKENIPKIYISHLVYSGRGLDNLKMDITKEQRIKAVNYIIDKALILFLDRFAKKYPDLKDDMENRLKAWGGNSAARKLLNIDSEGNVKPDPFFPYTIGNILKEDFSDIWQAKSELLTKLRQHPRKLGGKCSNCQYIDICNGGSRSRAWAIYDDLWAEDPSCYLESESLNG